MSALGDYIHFTAAGYETYGTARPGESRKLLPSASNIQRLVANRIDALGVDSKNLDDAIWNLKKYIADNTQSKNNMANMVSKTEFEKQINFIYEELAEFATKELYESFQAGGSQEKFFKPSKDIELISNKEYLQKYSDTENNQKLLRIYNKIDSLNQKGLATEQEIKELVSLYESVLTKKQKKSLYESKGINKNNIISAIQKDIDNRIIQKILSNFNGKFGEHLVVLLDDAIQGTAMDNLKNFMNSKVIGDQSSSISIKANDLFLKETSGKVFIDDEVIYTTRRTQNKVDCQIKINSKDAFASVKYYKPKKNGMLKTSLQSVNLFYTMVYLNRLQGDLGNHWLNMHVRRKWRIKDNVIQQDEALNNAIKRELTIEALVTGNPLKENVKYANVFIAIDSLNGKVYLESTSKMLTDDYIKKYITFKPDPSNLLIRNHYFNSNDNNDINAAFNRIKDILYTLHQYNISVKFNMALTDSNMIQL